MVVDVMGCLILFFSFSWAAASVSGQQFKPVTIQLRAKWNMVPFVVEASEYFAEYHYDKYWAYLHALSHRNVSSIPVCSQTDYDMSIAIASDILPDSLCVLKLVLTTRERSPKIEFYDSLQQEKNIPADCEEAFSVGKQVICGWNELKQVMSESNVSYMSLDGWDRLYNHSVVKSSAPLVFYYANIMSINFPVHHASLINLAHDGRIRYVIQPRIKERCKHSAPLSGYGATLHVKSSDYKAVDDQRITFINQSNAMYQAAVFEELSALVNSSVYSKQIPHYGQVVQSKDIFEINPKDNYDIRYAAIKYIAHGQTQDLRLHRLEYLAQNLPLVVKDLLQHMPSSKDRNNFYRFKQSSSTLAQLEEPNSIAINGKLIESDSSVFQLIPLIVSEFKVLEALKALSFNKDEALKFAMEGAIGEPYSFKLDVRSNLTLWLNDLENDSRYRYWSKNIEDILEQIWPGHFHEIGLNIFNLVIFVEPTSSHIPTALSIMQRMIQNDIPIRFGIILLTNMTSSVDRAISRGFLYLMQQSRRQSAITFLSQILSMAGNLTVDSVSAMFKKVANANDYFLHMEHHKLDPILVSFNKFYHNLGLRESPSVVFNGDIWPSYKISQAIGYHIINALNVHTQDMIKRVTLGKHHGVKHYEDMSMSGDYFAPRINTDILKQRDSILSMYDPLTKMSDDVTSESLSAFDQRHLHGNELYNVLLHDAWFITVPHAQHTVWLVLNLETPEGQELLYQSLLAPSGITRYGIILSHFPAELKSTLTYAIASLMIKHKVDDDQSILRQIIMKLLENVKEDPNYNVKQVESATEFDENKWRSFHACVTEKIFKVYDSNSYVIYNGMKFGPMQGDEYKFLSADFGQLSNLFQHTYSPLLNGSLETVVSSKLKEFSSKSGLQKVDFLDFISNILSTTIASRPSIMISDSSSFKDYQIRLQPRNEGLFLRIFAILDPLTADGQRWASILPLLYKAINCELHIVLNLSPTNEQLPPQRFYRFTLDSEIPFKQENGEISSLFNVISFNQLPMDAILTFTPDTHQSWFVEAIDCNCDMDNIHLESADDMGCMGIYGLEYIMIEGHAFDVQQGRAAAGLQLTMGPLSDPLMFDTIVIFNLGYFQFKGSPGAFILGLKNGKSSESYEITKVNSKGSGSHKIVTVDSFLGKVIRVEVSQKEHDNNQEVIVANDSTLENGGSEDATNSWWNSLSQLFKGGHVKQTYHESLNVFSLATGSLYERFMRIMMLSVLKNTETPVKFWFLKNYASPQFIESMKLLSQSYNFSYEFVQYQWPHWLVKQTDKQRVIWGYKILFLDVLFPLGVKKIIFVDADQIVRADLKELYTMNLEGAPYAYTPFCNDRPEMKTYRFWETGYWKSHLGRKPYHISALYVVDLERFREMMAGDRIRGQYQGLSGDPNSLANLDQDLPNNLQHVVPIKSLPQEWLWCETWCSDKSKEKAKTIDMCNNPRTHESKLDRAMRIAPEWIFYDEIVKKILSGDQGPPLKFNTSDTPTPPSSREADL